MGRIDEPALTRFDRVAFGAAAAVLAAVFCYLLGYCLLRTSVFDPADPLSEHVVQVWDSLPVNAALVAGWLVLLRLALRLEARVRLGWMTGISLGITFALGAAWVLVLRAIPINDTGVLYYCAAGLAKGDPSELWRHEAYLRAYPFQAGYMQYSELLQRLFGRHSTLPQGLVNAAFLTAAYGAVMDLTWRALRDRRVQLLTALLLPACVQPVYYVTFLYGNLPGLCLSLWAVCCLLRWVQGGRAWWTAAAVLLMAGAVVLKPNYLIMALAAAAVTALYALGRQKSPAAPALSAKGGRARRFGALALCALLLAAPMAADRLARRVLEKRTGFALGAGAPQTVWLAMGMQEGPLAPGWYNRYPLALMERAGLDTDAARALNRQDIADRLGEFAADPGYALSFYHEKMVSQWAETTFESLLVNRVMPNETRLPAAVDSLLRGRGAQAAALYMEGYALILYAGFALGAALLARGLWRRAAPALWARLYGPLILMICVLGGFLYHMLFEGKSQYLMVYLPMMVPLCAMGLAWRRAPVKAPPAP